MRYNAGLKQTTPLYQETNPSTGTTKVTYDAKGNRVTTNTTADVVVQPIAAVKPIPATKPLPSVVTPGKNYSPTGPNESQGQANIRWTEYLKKKKNSNPNPDPVPEVIPPVVIPGGPGGNTPPSTNLNTGNPGKPGKPGVPGYTIPGVSTSTSEKAPVNYNSGTNNKLVNNTRTKGHSFIKRIGWDIGDFMKNINLPTITLPTRNQKQRSRGSNCVKKGGGCATN